MRRAIAILLGCMLSACAAERAAAPGGDGRLIPQQTHAIPIATEPPASDPCGDANDAARCSARERDDVQPQPDSPALSVDSIGGYHPQDLQAAYGLSRTRRGGTIAIVVPYGYAAAESDLAVYRSKFGLSECTSQNGCLHTIDETRGATGASNAAWSVETAIDLQMASAACPSCALLLVEAGSDRMSDLRSALDLAVAARPAVISVSWTIPESLAGGDARSFDHPGIAVVAGSGDEGAGVGWPSDDPSVVAVGGTTLAVDATVARGYRETGWTMAGYGCSAIFAKPVWQTDDGCGMRAVADLSAVADPATGVAVYDSQPTGHGHWATAAGWAVYGGTSVAAPIVAGAIAQAGNAAELSTPEYIYAHADALNAVSAGASPLQSGLGSPNGSGGL